MSMIGSFRACCRLNAFAASSCSYRILNNRFSSKSPSHILVGSSKRNFGIKNELFNRKTDNLSANISKASKNWRVKEVLDLDSIYRHLVQDNAQDIAVLELNSVCNYVKYFIVATANSTRHLEYMAQSLNILYKKTKFKSDPFTRIEGKRISNHWMTIDLGNAVVHFMLEETREKYELEKLWLLGAQFDDQVKYPAQDETDLYSDEFIESSLNDVEFLESLNDFEEIAASMTDDNKDDDNVLEEFKDYIV